MNRHRNFAAVLMLLISLITITSSVSSSFAQSPAKPPRLTVIGQVEMLQDAPPFELKDLEGKTVRLQDYRGKAILLNFWATWCVPCKTEMPWFVEFQKKYADKGLVVLGVATDASNAAVRTFTDKMGINYPILLGTQAVADRYVLRGLPVTFYIDRQGRITDQTPGLTARSVIENEIKLALVNGVATGK